VDIGLTREDLVHGTTASSATQSKGGNDVVSDFHILYAVCLHDIAMTNIVWCMAYIGEVGGGDVYRAMVVQ